MPIKVLLVPGYGEPKTVWMDEARAISQQVLWVDDVVVSGGNPLGSYEQRAAEIRREVESRIRPDDQLIIIAHSFGGIVARFMTAVGVVKPTVIITIATPHRGVRHADVYVRASVGRIGPILVSWMFRRIYKCIASALGTDDRALSQLSTMGMLSFNEQYANVEGTSYLSYACVAQQVSMPLRIPHLMLSAYTSEPNDAAVTLESAKWGRFMGTIACDHLEVVGWPGPNRFDSSQFLVSVLQQVRLEVTGQSE